LWNASIVTAHSNAALFYYSNEYKNDFCIDSGYKNATESGHHTRVFY
jgi:hypothetical protein